MKIFKDQHLNEAVQGTLDLGIVNAGEAKRFTYFVHNNTEGYYRQLKFRALNEEVKVLNAPESLDPGEKGAVVLEWKPSVTIRKGLETQLVYEGEILYGKVA